MRLWFRVPSSEFRVPSSGLPITAHRSPFTIHHSPFTNSPFTIHHSPFTNSPFTIHQFTIHQFTNSPIHHSPIHHSPIHQFTIHQFTIHQFTIHQFTIHHSERSPMRRANLQAGLFGAVLAVLLGVIALLPYVGLCLAMPLYPVAFFLTGLAVVRLSDQPLSVGQATAGGAVAGLIAGAIGGLAAMFLAPLRLAIAGGPEQAALVLSPEMTQSLLARGLDPVAVMDFVAGVGAGIACCSLQLVSGMLLAGTGAALYAAYRRT
jgi:hypothetical protein